MCPAANSHPSAESKQASGRTHRGGLKSLNKIAFVKMHGLGNDYIFLDEIQNPSLTELLKDPARAAQILSCRQTAIGSDGLIILRNDPEHCVRMEMYNADGSRAEMCGNGIRCLARIAFERGYSQASQSAVEFDIQSDAGVRQVQVFPEADEFLVRVNMGAAQLLSSKLSLTSHDREFTGLYVSVGNPHFIIPLEEDLQKLDLEKYGQSLSIDPAFTEGANIEFVRVRSESQIDFRVWERGSGETQACGTGATAAGFALHHKQLVNAKSTVSLLGGDLQIECRENGECYMTGPATISYEGEFSAQLLE